MASSSKPYIFSRLDYFLVSNSIVNSVCDCTIIPGFKSDHSIVTMNIHLTSEQRGPGYFKINNSLLLQDNYQEKIRMQFEKLLKLIAQLTQMYYGKL